ncbi:MAG: peptidase M28 [Acidobacteria bacterium]|nr:MAG: peptidase M28 [Acidobacteriota bacterium]
MKLRWLAAAVFALTLFGAGDHLSEGKRWWSHIVYLADDKLEGRNTGSEGYHQAAVYVAGEFERAGLKPAGTSGYFQPVKFKSREVVEDQSSLALVQNGGEAQPLALGEDAMISMRVDPAAQLKAPVVFAGYGLTVPETKYDDFVGQNLRGKIIAYISGGPASIPGPLSSHYQSAGERGKFLERAGVGGTIVIMNPAAMDIPWPRTALSRFQPSMSLNYRDLDETHGQKLSVIWNPAHLDKLLAGSGHSAEEILALAKERKPLPRFPLLISLKSQVAAKRSEVESPNVVGLLPGSDPELKGEYVVLSAHLDHLGVGRPINGDSIYNGAMDDASGVATLLDIAERIHQGKPKLRRSLLFVVVTGEEKGLLGSRFYTAHPTVAAEKIVADLNVDMLLPLFPLRILSVYGLDESDLGKDVRAVAEPLGVRIQGDLEPQRNIFIRSDQYNFIRNGIPSLAFKVGYEKGSPEEAIAKKWLTDRYHAPSDDIHQPVDLKAAADFDRIILDVAETVANQSERPRWNHDSFFRRFAHAD